MKSGFVGIIGRPNVGKSTLMNHLIGQKIAITSKKPQTTRNQIRTVYTDDKCQIVFVDTPGIHKAKNRLGEYMVEAAQKSLKEVVKDEKLAKVGFYGLPKEGEKIEASEKVALLETLRFDPGEEENSPEFIKNIIDSVGAEVYVQDGFAVVHRAHASTSAVAEFLPVYMGLLVEKEVENLTKVIDDPEQPVLVIIGGAKVEDKKPLIDKFKNKANMIVVGGRIAADGYKGGDGIYVTEDFDEDASGEKLDVGPLATAKIAGYITDAKTIIWNGLLGKAEDPAYATASTIVAEMMGEKDNAETVVCGGDTAGFVENLMKDHPNLHYSLVSTGGGAALEFLVGKQLPGLQAIECK